ncbi:Uncharacterized protein ChrSV_2796 [Chromobacterium vaccinii]|nr:Uncharacterized protein ChrSW_2796 [Chromobacterium vaccinii]QND90253.1 Uncharacterized protein ChrSV_2796 [Chromobacterium vaccinii]
MATNVNNLCHFTITQRRIISINNQIMKYLTHYKIMAERKVQERTK